MEDSSLEFVQHEIRWLQTYNSSNDNEDESSSQMVTSTDSEIIRNTLRVYGSIYAACLLLYTILRRRHPKLFNIRSWARDNPSNLACSLQYSWCNWLWKVFEVPDHELMEECGMDAVCFLRALQFGRQLCTMGILNAIWLIPLYRTASDDVDDKLVKVSIANLPPSSMRFLGTVISAYITFGYAMYLIVHQVRWFTRQRHLFVSRKEPRNYAVYVSGIPAAYQSSHQLLNYFRQCGASHSAVLEAHICRDTPKLDALVQKRSNLIAQLEHAAALERRTGQTVQHTKIHWRRTSYLCCYACTSTCLSTQTSRNSDDTAAEINIMERVNSVHTLETQVRSLNRSIQRRIGEILAQSSRRGGLSRSSNAKMDLLKAIQEDAAAPSSSSSDSDEDEAFEKPTSSPSLVMTANTANEDKDGVVKEIIENDDDDDYEFLVLAEEDEKDSVMRRRLRTFSETLGAAVLPLAAKPSNLMLRARSATLHRAVAGGEGDRRTASAMSTATTTATATTTSISRPNSIRHRFVTTATVDGGSGGDKTTTATVNPKPSTIRHRCTTFAAAALPSHKSSSTTAPLPKPQYRRGISAALKIAPSSSEPDENDFRDDLLARVLESGADLYTRIENNSCKKDDDEEERNYHLHQQPCGFEDDRKCTEEADNCPATMTADAAKAEMEVLDLVAVGNEVPIERLDPTLEVSETVMDPSSYSNNNNLVKPEPRHDYFQQWLQQETTKATNMPLHQDFHQQWLQQAPATANNEQFQQHCFPSSTDDYDECTFMDNWLAGQQHHDNVTNNTDTAIPEDEPMTESRMDDDEQKSDSDLQRSEIMTTIDGDVEAGVVDISNRYPTRAHSDQNLYPSRALSEQSSSNSILSVPTGSNDYNNNQRRMHRSEGEVMESTRSGCSMPSSSSSKNSRGSDSGTSRRGASSRSLVTDSIRRGTRVVGRAGSTFAQGSRVAGSTIAKGSQVMGCSIAKGSQVATQAVGSSAEWLVQSVGERGGEALKKANKVGSHIVSSAGAVVPALLLNKEEGRARDAGFVVFTNLYAVQTALQMIHHPKPYVMDVIPAPDPKHIFWRNVGLPSQSKRSGYMMALTATAVLCFFWSAPMAFISSMTQVNSLKETLPRLGSLVEKYPWLQNVFAQLAPMAMLIFNELFLPGMLKYFATWEGHISSAMLEASLFKKLGCFMIIQTFFVSAVSGGITSELTNILEDPDSVIDLLANSLPSQSYFFVQIALAQTFVLQAIETLRVYPLGVAWLRRYIGPRLTAKERRRPFGWLCSLDEPPDFWHAETFAQIILFYVVFFVYSSIAPVTPIFLYFCFVLCESGYRYQFIHNYPRAFETGGALWRGFIHFVLASMVIAELTLIGLLGLKKSQFTLALIPLLVITVLFIMFINAKHSLVSQFLPTRDCILLDGENRVGGEMDMDFVKGRYLQPSLQHPVMQPDYDEGTDDYATS